MIILPKIRGFICTTAHPTGCFKMVESQVNYLRTQKQFAGPKRVLIIGASTGYGLASRIVSTYATGAQTIGVFLEKPADDKRTASAGWYNSAAFEQLAHKDRFYAKSILGDAFSYTTKQQTAALIREDFKQVDLIIYSIATPRRIHPVTKQIRSAVLKPIGAPFVAKQVDVFRREMSDLTIPPATPEEIDQTIAVMGGEDWSLWIEFLQRENLLAKYMTTVAYSYIGPELTYPIYKEGTIGRAKEHLQQVACQLQQILTPLQGLALTVINKAVVTQASAAIPAVPLYLSLLFKVMKEKNTHEGCVEQIYRLFHDYLSDAIRQKALFGKNTIRLDDLEMEETTQIAIEKSWPLITTATLNTLTDLEGYKQDFYHLFGFNVPGVDYQASVDPQISIPSLNQ